MNLEQFDQQFEQAETKGGPVSDLPPGKYDCTIVEAEIFESKEGRLYMKITFKVNEGDQAGNKATKIYQLDVPERFGFIKGDLAVLGKMPKKLSEIPAILPTLAGVQVSVTAQQKGEYLNYFFNAKKQAKKETSENVPW